MIQGIFRRPARLTRRSPRSVLMLDVFGRGDLGGWHAAPRLEGDAPPTTGLLAFGTLQFVDGALRTLGGQALDGAIHGLKLVAGGVPRRVNRRLPLMARYAAPIDPPGAPATEISVLLVRWEPSLTLAQAAITGAAATAAQLDGDLRAEFLDELSRGLDRWTTEWLRPSGEVWSAEVLWRRWVDAVAPLWHK